MQYLHMFDTTSEFNEEYGVEGKYEEPWISLTLEDEDVNYNHRDYRYLHMPFTIEALSSGNITWNLESKTLQYSKNEGEWQTMDSGTSIPVDAGDMVSFKGTNSVYCGNTISCTAQFNVMGNILSLTNGDDYVTGAPLTSGAFWSLIQENTGLISAKNLKITRADGNYAYLFLFSGCTSLVEAPELPAKSLGGQAYGAMFAGCTSLKKAPKLPATSTNTGCYTRMFENCKSLIKAPELLSPRVSLYAYQDMFAGCTSLVDVPDLPAATVVTSGYNGMFSGCTSLVVAPRILATQFVYGGSTGYYQQCREMFKGCTSLTVPPELPITELKASCYENMFQGCTSLTTAPVLPATYVPEKAYQNMFDGCTNLNYIKAMFTDWGNNGITNWVRDVAANGTFVKNSAATWTNTGNSGVPTGWTVETASS